MRFSATPAATVGHPLGFVGSLRRSNSTEVSGYLAFHMVHVDAYCTVFRSGWLPTSSELLNEVDDFPRAYDGVEFVTALAGQL